MTLRVLIVDDEPAARRRLAAMLRTIGQAEMVGEAGDVHAALTLAGQSHPDLILLDIDMPGPSGLDLARWLGKPGGPLVIFVTAFADFAVDAFGIAATDYLLKPVPLDRLSGALDRARHALASRSAGERLSEMASVIDALRRGVTRRPGRAVEDFWVQSGAHRLRLPVEHIRWIAAEEDYVRLHVAGGSHLIRDQIGRIESVLDPAGFVRVHRSTIIRRDMIAAVRSVAPGIQAVVMEDGASFRVGRKYAASVRAILQAAR